MNTTSSTFSIVFASVPNPLWDAMNDEEQMNTMGNTILACQNMTDVLLSGPLVPMVWLLLKYYFVYSVPFVVAVFLISILQQLNIGTTFTLRMLSSRDQLST